jgi:hypothetical protein
MKLVAVILSIITLTLSAITCDDESVYAVEQLTSISQSSDQSSDDGFDLCSPFCVCVCCPGVVLESNNQQDDLISEISTKELNTYYSPFFSSSFHTQIFQPPQV